MKIHHLLILIVGSLLLTFLLLFELPEVVLEQQIKYQTNQILQQNDRPNYGTDLRSKKILSDHHLHLASVSDEQGADENTSYHLGNTTEGYSLGIMIFHYHPHDLYSKIKIVSIKVWNPSQK